MDEGGRWAMSWAKYIVARLKWAPAHLCIMAMVFVWMLDGLGGCIARW